MGRPPSPEPYKGFNVYVYARHLAWLGNHWDDIAGYAKLASERCT